MLCGCVNHNLEDYKGSQPSFDIQDYFNGEIQAWGLVQDWRGKVVNQFNIHMVGEWDGDVGTLTEDFKYYDGKEQQRVWIINKLSEGRYVGKADDILGVAHGKSEGNAVKWVYTMDLPVGDKQYRIKFDDWMWRMEDGVVINRSYLKKFGITVAELSLFMKKVDQSNKAEQNSMAVEK